jgi:DNA-binding protein
MKIEISPVERDTLLAWADGSKSRAGRYGDGNAEFPEEQGFIDAIRAHQGGLLEVSHNQIVILLAWAESNVDSHFGRGAITNPPEAMLLKKITGAFESVREVFAEEVKEAGREVASALTAPKRAQPEKKPVFAYVLVVLLLACVIALWGAKKIILRQNPAAATRAVSSTGYSIREFIGSVEIKRNNVKTTVTKAGEMLLPGDTVFTGITSQICIGNGSNVMKADENSFIAIP